MTIHKLGSKKTNHKDNLDESFQSKTKNTKHDIRFLSQQKKRSLDS